MLVLRLRKANEIQMKKRIKQKKAITAKMGNWQNDDNKKHKPTNVGRIALERQARQINSWSLV